MNHQTRSIRFHQPRLLLIIAAIFTFAAPCPADQWDTALNDATTLAKIRLDEYNSHPLIKRMGGPITLDDYNITLKKHEHHPGLKVVFTTNRLSTRHGFPEKFDIFIDLQPGEGCSKKGSVASSEFNPQQIAGQFTNSELATLLEKCKTFRNWLGDTCITTIDISPDGKFSQRAGFNYDIKTITRINKNLASVTWSDLSAHETGPALTLEKQNGQWQPVHLIDNTKRFSHLYRYHQIKLASEPLIPLQQSFTYCGELDDQQLLQAIQLARHVKDLAPQITKVSDIKNTLLIDTGQRQPLFTNYLVTFSKTPQGWKIIRIARGRISNFQQSVFYKLPALANEFETCPNGHPTLIDAPIEYGYGTEGGCVITPNSPKSKVKCTTCEFQFNSNFYSNYWERDSIDPNSFQRPFSKRFLSFPRPDKKNLVDEIKWRQDVVEQKLVGQNLSYTTKASYDQVCKQIEQWLDENQVQTNRSEDYSTEWRNDSIFIMLQKNERDNTCWVMFSDDLLF